MDVRPVFSRCAASAAAAAAAEGALPDPAVVHVQDRLLVDMRYLWAAFDRGACFYLCGDAVHLGAAVRDVITQMVVTRRRERQTSPLDAADARTAAAAWVDLQERGHGGAGALDLFSE